MPIKINLTYHHLMNLLINYMIIEQIMKVDRLHVTVAINVVKNVEEIARINALVAMNLVSFKQHAIAFTLWLIKLQTL